MENELTMKMDPIARCCIRTDVQYIIMMVMMMKSIACGIIQGLPSKNESSLGIFASFSFNAV